MSAVSSESPHAKTVLRTALRASDTDCSVLRKPKDFRSFVTRDHLKVHERGQEDVRPHHRVWLRAVSCP